MRPKLVRLVAPSILSWLLACGGSGAPAAYPEEAVSKESPQRAESYGFQDVQVAGLLSSSSPTNMGSSRTAAPIENASLRDRRSVPGYVASRAAPSQPVAGLGGVQPTQAPRPSPSATDAHDGKMLVYTAALNLAVYQVTEKMNAVEQLVREHGGYLAKRDDHQITVRVPKEHFSDVLAAIEKYGDVLHRDVQATDVTEEFLDVEVRLKNARAVRDRFEALLAQASVKDSIEIAKELAKVTEIIEKLEGQLKLLSNRITFATVSITFSARDTSSVADRSILPFPWMQRLGLNPLLSVQTQ